MFLQNFKKASRCITAAKPLSSIRFHHARVRHSAPDFKGDAVVNGQFEAISLKQYKDKWLVLFFYPLDFTFVCPSEIIAYNDRLAEFEALNAKVVGVSVDSKYSHLAWSTQPRKEGGLGSLKIPLVADITKKISTDYGVLIEEDGVAARGIFIIDQQQIIRQVTINDLDVGRSVDETLRLLEAYQFAQEHGQVCPVNWKRGAKTITATPVGSKEYFKAVNK